MQARPSREQFEVPFYQFGDHDPTGVLIPRSIERRLEEMCETLGCSAPIVERVAQAALRVAEGSERELLRSWVHKRQATRKKIHRKDAFQMTE